MPDHGSVDDSELYLDPRFNTKVGVEAQFSAGIAICFLTVHLTFEVSSACVSSDEKCGTKSGLTSFRTRTNVNTYDRLRKIDRLRGA